MSRMPEKTVLAVDPGSAKCGLALVERSATGQIDLLWRGICAPSNLREYVDKAAATKTFSMAIVGSGTKSKNIVHELREYMPSVGILIVDEKDTTIQARERYWEHHKRRGWRKLLPATLQVPPEPFDDFAAMILAERVLAD